KRLIEEALSTSKDAVGEFVEGQEDATRESSSSIPWSAYITQSAQSEPTSKTSDKAQNADAGKEQQAAPKSPNKIAPPSTNMSTPVKSLDLMGPGSSPAMTRSSERIRRTRTQASVPPPASSGRFRRNSIDELALSAKKAKAQTPDPATFVEDSASRRSQQSINTKTKKASLKDREPDELLAEDIAARLTQYKPRPSKSRSTQNSEPSAAGQSQEQVEPPSRKRKAKQDINSDDMAIGLPKEQYKPRPSRSRSTQVLEEPIDYSVVPERAAKRKSKRRKTVGDDLSLQIEEEDTKLQSLQDMGFSPETSRKTLMQHSGNVENAVADLVNKPPTAASASRDQRTDETAGKAEAVADNGQIPVKPSSEQQKLTGKRKRGAKAAEAASASLVRVEIPHVKSDAREPDAEETIMVEDEIPIEESG
ncbi:hypothetical protein LTS18_015041, partial [Coniosporium uncinatum]